MDTYLCIRRCVSASFASPLSSSASSTSLYGIDVSLVAVSLATLFAIVKRGDLSRSMSQPCLAGIFQECLRRIVDPRLSASTSISSSPKSQESSKDTIAQVD
jgi:hypothetical protein